MSEEEVSGSEAEEETTTTTTATETKEEVTVDPFAGMTKRQAKKEAYKIKLNKLLDEYNSVLIIGVDNVGSSQMQSVRIALRGRGVMLMGKNTMIRNFIKQRAEERKTPGILKLNAAVRQNMGFVFTNENLSEIRNVILENKVPAAAKAGAVAQSDVFVPPGPTGMDPGQTSFFQALGIATKIERGNISIVDQVHLIKEGEKVTASHVVLLQKLSIQPFHFGITVKSVFSNGALFPVAVLDISDSDVLGKFMTGVSHLAALSFSTGLPCVASVPFQVRNAFKKMVALSLESGFEFTAAKEYIAKCASGAAASAAAAAPAAGAAPAAAAAAAAKEPSEEESVGGLGGMF